MTPYYDFIKPSNQHAKGASKPNNEVAQPTGLVIVVAVAGITTHIQKY